MIYHAKGGHIGGCFSVIDLLTNIYSNFLKFDNKNPEWEDRDYLILSKGHCCIALYVTLYHFGFFGKEIIESYSLNGGKIGGHPKKGDAPGIEATTGSLGHGLGIANGLALGNKLKSKNNKVFVVMSDGEMNEGSVWESVLFAAQHNLNNLYVILDNNNQISLDSLDNILSIEPVHQKFSSFGWNVKRINGHSHKEIKSAISSLSSYNERPNVVIADTIKGKGVSFMEGVTKWHYRGPNDEEYMKALKELKEDL
jgi:transketolase